MGRQPRQRPISCHFCRVRKLRCSRTFPCTNCSSRGLACPESQDPPQLSQSSRVNQTKASASSNSNADVLKRLERLEALLSDRTKQFEIAASPPPNVPTQNDGIDNFASLQPLAQQVPSNVSNLTADALFLERNCLGPKLSDSVLADRITFRVCPIRSITKSSSCYIFQPPSIPSSSLSFEPTRCIWLPQREEMLCLIEKYIIGISHIRHIVHAPSLKALVDDVYGSMEQGTRIPVASVVVLVSVCADVTFSWTFRDEDCGLFGSSDEANSQSFFWLKEGMDLADNAQHGADMSIELIQGILLLSFVICNVEGISIRARSYVSRATVLARELGLHRIDHPNNGHLAQLGWNEVKVEVGRRLWWYIAATDWLKARFPGPHEGTYSINPQHMAVKKPLNINDEGLVDGKTPLGLPIEQPTCMSYFLQRIRLAELSRTFVDRMSLANTDPCSLGYNLVQELDMAIDKLIQEIPAFFNAKYSELRKLPITDPRRSPSVIVQRHVLNLFVHGQRCKLHLPYLVRGTVEPEYVNSREICLSSAALILDMEHELEQEGIPFVETRLRLAVALHSVFLAGIAILIDLCLASGTGDKTSSQQRMTQVWRILEDANEHSAPAAKLQDLLRQVMNKYKVPLPVFTRGSEPMIGDPGNDTIPLTPASGTNPGLSTTSGSDNPRFIFPELVNFESSMDLDSIDWEGIMWNLDASIM